MWILAFLVPGLIETILLAFQSAIGLFGGLFGLGGVA